MLTRRAVIVWWLMNTAFNQTFYKLVDVNLWLLIIHTFKYSDGRNISWMPFFLFNSDDGFYEPGIALINLQSFCTSMPVV